MMNPLHKTDSVPGTTAASDLDHDSAWFWWIQTALTNQVVHTVQNARALDHGIPQESCDCTPASLGVPVGDIGHQLALDLADFLNHAGTSDKL